MRNSSTVSSSSRASMPEASRVAEALATLSVATELAKGQPRQSAMGAAILACRIGRHLGPDESAPTETFYAALLRLLGCASISL